jgi:hypothetical protein
MPIGITNIHIQINVSLLINKLSFICVLWFSSCSLLKWRQNYHFSTIIISNSQIETLVSYSRSTNINVNMSFPNSNFEGNFSTYVFCKSFWHYWMLKIHCWTSRHILCEKILNAFVCVEIRIIVEKWNVYEIHIFPRPLLQIWRLEKTSFCLNTRLFLNKKFSNSLYFNWN